MEIRKEDLVKIRSFEDVFFYGIRLDICDKEEIPESVEEVKIELDLEAQKKKDAEIAEALKAEAKALKKAKLLKELEELEE